MENNAVDIAETRICAAPECGKQLKSKTRNFCSALCRSKVKHSAALAELEAETMRAAALRAARGLRRRPKNQQVLANGTFGCRLPLEIANQVARISLRTGCPVSHIFRRFFNECWVSFLRNNPEWKALAELGPVVEEAETGEGEIAATA